MTPEEVQRKLLEIGLEIKSLEDHIDSLPADSEVRKLLEKETLPVLKNAHRLFTNIEQEKQAN